MVQSLIKQIKHHEGYRSRVYKCTEGYDTIGYGFAIKDLVVSEEVCEMILLEKLEFLEKSIKNRFSWYDESPQVIKEVIMNMCYQLGITGVSKFRKAISALQEGDWDEAADEMLDSLWARQTPNRATELSHIVRNQSEKASS